MLFKPNVEKMQRKRDVAGLIRTLKDDHDAVWLPAAEALAAIGDERAIDPLFERMQRCHTPRVLRLLAAFPKEEVAERLLSLNTSGWPTDQQQALFETLTAMGEPAVGPLSRELWESRPDLEAYQLSLRNGRCLKALGHIGGLSPLPIVKRYLKQCIDDFNPRLCGYGGEDNCVTYAAEYLSQHYDDEAVDLLCALQVKLSDCFELENHTRGPSAHNPRASANVMSHGILPALGKIRSERAVPALEAIANHEFADDFVKRLARSALAAIRGA